MAKFKNDPTRFAHHAETLIRIIEALNTATDEAVPKPKPVKTETNLKPELCSDHPSYGAKRPPRTDCSGCWTAYKSFNPMNYDKALRDFKRKQSSA